MSRRRSVAHRNATRRLATAAGVTLLELMIVVTVVGILGIVALPSYRQYSLRAQRTDAKQALLRLAANQERFYLENRRYGGDGDFAALGFAAPMKSEHGAYVITIASADDTLDYTATAAVTSGGRFDQTSDADCQSFTIDATGARRALPDPQRRCW